VAITGGGGTVGGANFELSADASAVTEALEKIRAELKATENAAQQFGKSFEKASSGLIVPAGVKKSLDDVASGFDKVDAAAKKAASNDALKKHQEDARAAAADTKKFTGSLNELAEATKKETAATKEETDAVAALKKQRKEFIDIGIGKSVPGAPGAGDVTATALAVRKLTNEAKLLQQTFPSDVTKQRLGAISTELEALHKNVGAAFKGFPEEANKAAASMSLVGRVTGAADKFLGGFGLSVRGVSVLLGAGLATGLAGIIRITEKLGGALVKFVSEESELERQTAITFGHAGDSVLQFADTSAAALGATRRETIETLNAFGLLARQLDLPLNIQGNFAEQLTQITALIETRGVPGLKNLADVTKAVEAGVNGDTEALKNLGISSAEFAEIAQREFGKLPDQLTPTERAIVAIDALTKQAASSAKELGDGQEGFWGPLGDFIGHTVEIVRTGLKEMSLEHLEAAAAAGKQAVTAVRLRHVSTEELFVLKELAKAHKDTVAIIQAEIDRREDHARAVEKGTAELKKQIEALHLNEQAFLQNKQLQQQAADALQSLTRAQEDGVRQVQEAEERLARTREDNARKLRDIITRNERAAIDAAIRVNQAEQALEDARVSRTRRLEDAQDKVDDARLQASRANRTAQERLDDFERDSARKIIDLKQRVAQAHKQEARDTTEAQIAVETALLHRDEAAFNAAARELSRAKQAKTSNDSLRDAEKALAREEEDHAIQLKRLQRDLIETRKDGARDVSRAIRDQQRAERDGLREIQRAQDQLNQAKLAQVRAQEDATKALSDYEVEANRALFDAAKGVRDAERQRDRAIADASKAFERLAASIGLTVDRLKELLATLSFQFVPFGPFGFAPAFAAGGDFGGGSPIIVGEKGPELIIPKSAGTVVSNDDLVKALRSAFSGGGGSGTSHTWHVTNTVDEHALAAAIEARLVKGVG
jgi:hypothetical protein